MIDGKVAFVGGIDLTLDGGDPWDTPSHVARGGIGWHDAAVRIEGPAVADVAQHFRLRWHGATREAAPAPDRSGRGRWRGGADREDASGRHVPRGAARRLLDPRVVHRSAALGRAVRLPREPVPVVAGDRVGARREAQRTRRATTSASSSSCRRERTTVRTSRAARSRHSSTRPTRRRGSSPARSTRGRGTFAIRCTSIRRSGSSTTAGSPSARRT